MKYVIVSVVQNGVRLCRIGWMRTYRMGREWRQQALNLFPAAIQSVGGGLLTRHMLPEWLQTRKLSSSSHLPGDTQTADGEDYYENANHTTGRW
jgi:hypothetical protein